MRQNCHPQDSYCSRTINSDHYIANTNLFCCCLNQPEVLKTKARQLLGWPSAILPLNYLLIWFLFFFNFVIQIAGGAVRASCTCVVQYTLVPSHNWTSQIYCSKNTPKILGLHRGRADLPLAVTVSIPSVSMWSRHAVTFDSCSTYHHTQLTVRLASTKRTDTF